MTSGDRDRRPSSPKHLWAGDWQSESEAAREAPEAELPTVPERVTEVLTPESPPPPPDPRPPSRRRRPEGHVLAIGLLLAAALVGSILVGRAVIDGDDGDKRTADSGSDSRPGGTAAQVYASASPAVVSIKAGADEGTGFLIARDGRIVTNSHVVGDIDSVRVTFGRGSAAIDAEVLGTDPSSDLAVIRIPEERIPAGVSPLRFADSDQVTVGDTAIAIGNPFGLDRTATEGIVSAVGRQIQAPNGFSIDSVIQTDAPINPGNSGGPLLNDGGRVIGVNSQIATAGAGGNVGVGFAVPSNVVRDVIPRIARGDTIKRAYLGVESVSMSPAGRAAVVLTAVVPGSPAERAGLSAGDIITRADGAPVREPGDVSAAVADHKPGDRISLVMQRGLARRTVQITLGSRPERTP